MQKSNEKEKKTGTGCQTSPFANSFLFLEKKGKDLP